MDKHDTYVTGEYLLKNNRCSEVYESPKIVSPYSKRNMLQKPELSILNIMKEKLRASRMLDIGVGGGRTTGHFARIAKEYVGADYSKRMINACVNKFPDFDNCSFTVCDMKNMCFNDKSFDFVLISYNSIDTLSYEDRLKTFEEVNRVLTKGGSFCFSTHNIRSIRNMTFSINPVKTATSVFNYILISNTNDNMRNRLKQKSVMINDGAHNFRIMNYYMEAEEQIRVLSKFGFNEIRVFSLWNGKEIKGKSKLVKNRDPWLYFLCHG